MYLWEDLPYIFSVWSFYMRIVFDISILHKGYEISRIVIVHMDYGIVANKKLFEISKIHIEEMIWLEGNQKK